ncbi:MAG: zf-HC2 domain-containing protein [Blastocatellia bacterium]
MALERTNTASRFDGEFDGEFDLMLRRHLKQGGSPAAACDGFDADQAGAYLENGLGRVSRGDFEQHLSGCAHCRGHLIALSRLIPESEPVIVPAREAAKGGHWRWLEIRKRLSEWLDPREWRWDWQTMGLAGTAAAILILAVVAQPWLAIRSTEPAERSAPLIAVQPDTPASGGGLGDTRATQTSNESEARPEASPLGSLAAPGAEYRAGGGRIPIPEVTPLPGADPGAREIASTELSKKLSMQGVTAAVVPPAASSRPVNFNDLPQAFTSQPPPAPPPAIVATLDAAQEEPSRLGPSPEDNPMRTISTSAAKRRDRQPERATSSARPSLLDRAIAFAPARKASDKDANSAAPAAEDETAHFLIVRIHNRVFRFEDGTWIDQEYKPEMQWRITKLIHGSAEFQRVLEQEPQLKPYFDKRSIIVVWRDKIYKITGK